MAKVQTCRVIFEQGKRRYSIKFDPGRVSYRDLTSSRTGVSISANQEKAIERIYKGIEAAITKVEVPEPLLAKNAGPSKPAAKAKPAAKPVKGKRAPK